MFGNFQLLVVLVLTVAIFAVELWAFVDAVTRKPAAFTYAGKKTKQFWLALTGVATLLGLLTLPPAAVLNPFGIFNLAALVIAGIYLADVRPAVRQFRPRNQSGQGGYGAGPYGGY